MSAGRVTLVGAGPGDPELLTLKAVRAIREATVLLVDDLVSDAVLAFANPSARIVHVGKRGGCTSTPQAFIDKLMLAAALKGDVVVRLKGGDPLLFGRGGEEGAMLRAHGVQVDVVSGITAGIAAATELGVALTHRDHAHGVMFVTGHARVDGIALDWPSLGAAAAQGLTLVIYMGISAIDSLTAGLLRALPAHTPAAAVQHASLPHSSRVVTTLGALAADIRNAGIASPAVIVVGDVLLGVSSAAGRASSASEPQDSRAA